MMAVLNYRLDDITADTINPWMCTACIQDRTKFRCIVSSVVRANRQVHRVLDQKVWHLILSSGHV